MEIVAIWCPCCGWLTTNKKALDGEGLCFVCDLDLKPIVEMVKVFIEGKE